MSSSLSTSSGSARLLRAVDALPLTRRHWLVFGICSAGFFFDSVDLQLMSLVAPVLLREWDMTPNVVGLLSASAMLGMFFGALILGTLADRIGRRAGVQLSIGVFSVFSGLCALAQDPVQLTVARFCVGLGLGGLIPVNSTLLSEYLPDRWRGRMVALWAVAFPVGGLFAASAVSAVLPTLGWRGVFLVGVLPAVLIVVVRRHLPDPPRFLVARGRFTEAERSARWIAGGHELEVPAGSADTAVPARVPVRDTVRVLFTRPQWPRTAVAMGMTFGWSFAFFGMVLWLPTLLSLAHLPIGDVLRYTLGFQVSAIAGRLAMLLLVDRVGRKPVIVSAGAGAGVLALVFGWSDAMPWLVLVGFALSFCQDAGMTGIVPYTPELFGTAVRASGSGLAIGAGRVAGLLAPLVVGALVTAGRGGVVFGLFSGCFLLAAVLVAVVGVETKPPVVRGEM